MNWFSRSFKKDAKPRGEYFARIPRAGCADPRLFDCETHFPEAIHEITDALWQILCYLRVFLNRFLYTY
jgi:hypothetical protein